MIEAQVCPETGLLELRKFGRQVELKPPSPEDSAIRSAPVEGSAIHELIEDGQRAEILSRGKFDSVYVIRNQAGVKEKTARLFRLSGPLTKPVTALYSAYVDALRHVSAFPKLLDLRASGTVRCVYASYIEGEPLKEYVTRNLGENDRIATVFLRLADGLMLMHDTNRLNLDLKPANILVRAGDEQPFFIDIGAYGRPHARTPGFLLTSPGYVPLSQRWQTNRLAQIDVHSFGVCMLECLFPVAPVLRMVQDIEWLEKNLVPTAKGVVQQLGQVAARCLLGHRQQLGSAGELRDELAKVEAVFGPIKAAVKRFSEQEAQNLAIISGRGTAGKGVAMKRGSKKLDKTRMASPAGPKTGRVWARNPEQLLALLSVTFCLAILLIGTVRNVPGTWLVALPFLVLAVFLEAVRGVLAHSLRGRWTAPLLGDVSSLIDGSP